MNSAAYSKLVQEALLEDRALKDVTTLPLVPGGTLGEAHLVARQACVVAGTEAFVATFESLGGCKVRILKADGESAEAGEVIAEVHGELRSILRGERVALNFIQRGSGIATLTRQYVLAAGDVSIRDTRKTTPGLRDFEKSAVRAGGGTNHRRDLGDRALIKDNHLAVVPDIAQAVQSVREATEGIWVEVECDTLDQVREALEAGADEVLLDNMSPEDLKQAVGLVDGRCRTEASGGITLDSVPSVAATGVDAISVGALTHSARAVDLSLEVRPL